MKLEDALHAEISYWEDQRKAATFVEQSSRCEAVLGALRAVEEKASGAAARKEITEAGGAMGALGRGRGDARD